MISAVPSVSSVHVELDGRLPSTAGRTDETTKGRSVRPTWGLFKLDDELVIDGIRNLGMLSVLFQNFLFRCCQVEFVQLW
jgi:hypothetical protein